MMNLTTREMTLIAVFPALMAATAWLSIPIGIGAPLTLQTLFVMLAGTILGEKLGTISILIYVLLGFIGLPIFAGMQGGPGVIFGPTGGFIISFILLAYFAGKMKSVKIINNEFLNIVIILIVGNILLYMIGGTYMSYVLKLDLRGTLAILMLFVFGDFVKILLTSYVYINIRPYLTYEGSQIWKWKKCFEVQINLTQ